jgi:hypothetical protein
MSIFQGGMTWINCMVRIYMIIPQNHTLVLLGPSPTDPIYSRQLIDQHQTPTNHHTTKANDQFSSFNS